MCCPGSSIQVSRRGGVRGVGGEDGEEAEKRSRRVDTSNHHREERARFIVTRVCHHRHHHHHHQLYSYFIIIIVARPHHHHQERMSEREPPTESSCQNPRVCPPCIHRSIITTEMVTQQSERKGRGQNGLPSQIGANFFFFFYFIIFCLLFFFFVILYKLYKLLFIHHFCLYMFARIYRALYQRTHVYLMNLYITYIFVYLYIYSITLLC